MKYYESNYKEYINSLDRFNLHTYYNGLFKEYDFEDLPNCIFYGPSGIGKYSQVLQIINNYSESKLAYEKKVLIPVQNKDDYVIKISDIHFEIDMDLLGCNARTLWYDIYNQIVDIIMAGQSKKGIILCKNFQNIHHELLDIFYCYLNNTCKTISIKFFIISNNISFIPHNLIKNMEIISFKRPNNKMYKKVIKNSIYNELTCSELKKVDIINVNNVTNIKSLYSVTQPVPFYKNICDDIYKNIIKETSQLDYFDLRESIYNILLYHHDVYDCFYYILERLYNNGFINVSNMLTINIKVIELAKLYNNNYRPIFHLERFSLYLNSVVNDNELQNSA